MQGSGVATSEAVSSSPAMSPLHPHSRLPHGLSTVKHTQKVAVKAAAQLLVQVMASQTAQDDDDEDDADMGFKFRVPTIAAIPVSSYATNLNNNKSNSNSATSAFPRNSLSGPQRSPSRAFGRNFADHGTSVRSTSAGRPSMSVRSTPLVTLSKSTLRTPVEIPPLEPPIAKNQQPLRYTLEVDKTKLKDAGDHREASALLDELDMLQEENQNLLEKIRLRRGPL